MSTIEVHTYQEWNDLGYHIKRGEKASGRNEAGLATFSRDQVNKYDNWVKWLQPGDLEEMGFPGPMNFTKGHVWT